MEIKKEGKVVFENGQIIEIREFEIVCGNNDKNCKRLLEEYVKNTI